jgi:hypothetical protein
MRTLANVATVQDTAGARERVRAVLPPAFHIREAAGGDAAALAAARENVGFVQRLAGGASFFFVANVSALAHDLRVQVDVGHRRPERWDLETGAVEPAVAHEHVTRGGRKVTEVPLHLEPFESVVLAFGDGARKPAASGRPRRSEAAGIPAIEVPGPWTLALGDRPAVPWERLRSWDEVPEGKAYSGWATYEAEFEAPPFAPDVAWVLELGQVHETAEALLNGIALGAAWKAPRRLDCAGALRPGRNRLKVLVANLWVHAMVHRPPPPEWKALEETAGIRWGRYGEVPPDKMPPAGLLGPVRLVPRKLR